MQLKIFHHQILTNLTLFSLTFYYVKLIHVFSHILVLITLKIKPLSKLNIK